MTTMFQTIAWFSDEYLAFPPYVAAYNEIESILELFRKTGIATNLLVIGETGSGKTTLCKALLKKYPRISLSDRDVIPILYVPMPTPASLDSLAEVILTSLGDPGAAAGRLRDKTRRIENFIRALKIEMIIFDEAQHLQERGQHYTQYMSADWLKQLLDAMSVPVVFMGLPQFEKLLQANPQLRRRFSRRRNLQLGQDKDSDINNECLQMFISLGTTLPLRLSSGTYSWEELGVRIYHACDGRVGYVKKLLLGAIRLAMERSLDELAPDILEEAFTQEIWWEAIGSLNPFNANFAFRKLNRNNEPFYTTSSSSERRVRR
jgi:DNA transposition AAA+ family ATPase